MTANRRGRPPHDDLLTPAEWRVAELVRHGLTNRRIAERMGVSTDAVKFHVANALAKVGVASRQELKVWSGVARHSLLNRGRSAMDRNSDNEGRMTLGQIARRVTDFDSARSWYRDVLGLPLLYAFPGLAFFDLGGVRLMITGERGEGPAGESILYLRVADVHAAKADLEARGIRFSHAPHLIHRHDDGTEEWMAFFEDDEGRPLGLMAQVGPKA
ncbi:MAG TPA: LuxR C-terminal-related transcriptional regulator [Allosphingosinicella sp.]|jgi:DNA-binding CsgD family transcriptional regulator/catechol 2,3-dioxygenase-like lactoylglutathione lyase family enzyme